MMLSGHGLYDCNILPYAYVTTKLADAHENFEKPFLSLCIVELTSVQSFSFF